MKTEYRVTKSFMYRYQIKKEKQVIPWMLTKTHEYHKMMYFMVSKHYIIFLNS